MLPANYQIRHLDPADYTAIIAICKLVYPTETPYTVEELDDHRRVFPQGQFVATDVDLNQVAGVHFTLRLRMFDFHIDDPWDVLTSGGTFLDHAPTGPTLYGADIMVHPGHQHHGLAHALTNQTRFLVQEERLWRMVGASRLPGYAKHSSSSLERFEAIRGRPGKPTSVSRQSKRTAGLVCEDVFGVLRHRRGMAMLRDRSRFGP